MTDTKGNVGEDIALAQMALIDAQYKASRFAVHGYGHLQQDAIENLEEAKNIIEETLERHE